MKNESLEKLKLERDILEKQQKQVEEKIKEMLKAHSQLVDQWHNLSVQILGKKQEITSMKSGLYHQSNLAA